MSSRKTFSPSGTGNNFSDVSDVQPQQMETCGDGQAFANDNQLLIQSSSYDAVFKSGTSIPPPSEGGTETLAAQAELVKIPEVLEHIFNYFDVNQLKLCRFVSTAWNHEACRALQKQSHVYLHEDSARNNDFQELVGRGKALGLLSPFRRYFLSIDLFRDGVLQELIENENTVIVELYMNQSPSSNNSDFQRCLHRILKKNSATLRYLRLALKDGINLGCTAEAEEKTELFLPTLQDFGFWEIGRGSNKAECIDFIVEIINSAPNLNQLCSSCADTRVLEEILLRTNLSHVENIYAEAITGRHIRLLTSHNIPKLKSLILQSEVDELDEDQLVSSAVLLSMVRNFADSLEELNLSWISSSVDTEFPLCPKLKTLNLDGWDGSLGIFDPFRLPALKSIFITNHDEDEEDSFFNPHDGVEKLTVECTRGVGGAEAMYTDEEFDYLLMYSSIQFPLVSYLDLTMAMTDETVRSIIRVFPHITTLILDTSSRLSSHVFTGRNKFAVAKFLAEGNGLFDIDIMPSLRDLKSLKKLVLGRYVRSSYPEGFCLTNDIVRYGIAEIPGLEEFQFNWTPDLSVPVFRDFLGHLTKIVVNNSFEREIQGPIRELFACMQQVQLEANSF